VLDLLREVECRPVLLGASGGCTTLRNDWGEGNVGGIQITPDLWGFLLPTDVTGKTRRGSILPVKTTDSSPSLKAPTMWGKGIRQRSLETIQEKSKEG